MGRHKRKTGAESKVEDLKVEELKIDPGLSHYLLISLLRKIISSWNYGEYFRLIREGANEHRQPCWHFHYLDVSTDETFLGAKFITFVIVAFPGNPQIYFDASADGRITKLSLEPIEPGTSRGPGLSSEITGKNSGLLGALPSSVPEAFLGSGYLVTDRASGCFTKSRMIYP